MDNTEELYFFVATMSIKVWYFLVNRENENQKFYKKLLSISLKSQKMQKCSHEFQVN